MIVKSNVQYKDHVEDWTGPDGPSAKPIPTLWIFPNVAVQDQKPKTLGPLEY